MYWFYMRTILFETHHEITHITHIVCKDDAVSVLTRLDIASTNWIIRYLRAKFNKIHKKF